MSRKIVNDTEFITGITWDIFNFWKSLSKRTLLPLFPARLRRTSGGQSCLDIVHDMHCHRNFKRGFFHSNPQLLCLENVGVVLLLVHFILLTSTHDLLEHNHSKTADIADFIRWSKTSRCLPVAVTDSFRALALRRSFWRRANARNVSF